jgi:arylsulfatase A-like enzyme
MPNVLFIIIDSARVDHFSTYGYEKATTPFFDATAGDLTVYNNANTPAAWTRPAMNSIFTSLYPEQYGFFDTNYPGDDIPFLSGILKDHGYRVFMLSNNAYMSPPGGFDRGTDRFYFLPPNEFPKVLDRSIVLRHIPGLVRRKLSKRTAFKVFPQMINDQAAALLRRAQPDGKPLFVYIHHDAHHPYLSERKLLRRFLDPGISESEIRLVEEVQRSGNMYWFTRQSLSRHERYRYYTILRAMHDASIYKNDRMIARLFDILRSTGRYDDTMIIITADHGEFLGERDLISHGLYLYEESVRVPLLVKYPKGTGGTGTSNRLVSTIDLMPTILDLAGLKVRDFIPAAQGASLISDNEHEFVVTQRKNFAKGLDFWRRKHPDHYFDAYDYGNLICFKMLTRKFVWSSKGKHTLFDLEQDAGETANVYGANERSRTYLSMAEEWIARVPKVRGGAAGEFDEKIKRHLRGLGYIE